MKFQIRQKCYETNSSSMHSCVMTKKNKGVRMTQDEIRDEFYLNEDWYKAQHKNDEQEIVKLYFYHNEFGRSPFEVLSSFKDKLAYAIAEYCGSNYNMKSYISAENVFDDMFKPLLIRLIGCDDIEWDNWESERFVVYSDDKAEYFDEFEEVPYGKMVYINKSNKKDFSEDDLINDCYANVDKDGRHIENAYFDVPNFGYIDHESCGRLRVFLKTNNIPLEDFLVRKDILVVIDGDEYQIFNDMVDCGLIDVDNIEVQYPDYIHKRRMNNEDAD